MTKIFKARHKSNISANISANTLKLGKESQTFLRGLIGLNTIQTVFFRVKWEVSNICCFVQNINQILQCLPRWGKQDNIISVRQQVDERVEHIATKIRLYNSTNHISNIQAKRYERMPPCLTSLLTNDKIGGRNILPVNTHLLLAVPKS